METPDSWQTNYQYDQRREFTSRNSRLPDKLIFKIIRGGNLLLELQATAKLIFKIIRGGNLLLETPDYRQIFNMIKGEPGVGGGLSTYFLPFICDVKAASSILATLTSLEQ